MKLEKLEIRGFRKCNYIDIQLGDATFLIGENNVGKSSILRAIELLLTANTPTAPARARIPSRSYIIFRK